MQEEVENKVVLVTGGARNTGLEIVDLFLSEGAKVYFCTRAEESLKGGIAELERRGRTGFRGILCSVADPKSVDAKSKKRRGGSTSSFPTRRTSALDRELRSRQRTTSSSLSWT